ncbi:HAD family hydrolase [Achromobacter spanius]|uniref:HAD family hydrolase n=1 Tax=Achromobacter spanius TaxID=217203 RepID=UPI001F53F6E8|nr:HAD-IA family hydrolase [Achromobacter spanius]
MTVQPDFCAWSYEASAVKPQPEIYQYLCDGIGCRPEEVLMIGDTIEADMVGPRKFGMHGYHLNRLASTPTGSDSLRTLSDVLHLV